MEVEQLLHVQLEQQQNSVNSIAITSEGSGYPTTPIVTISAPAGAGVTATGIASITSDGKINSINLITPGIGYTVAPSVSIAGFSTIGVGTFTYNEIVTGETSGTTARVRDFRITPSKIVGQSPTTYLRLL